MSTPIARRLQDAIDAGTATDMEREALETMNTFAYQLIRADELMNEMKRALDNAHVENRRLVRIAKGRGE